MHTGAAAIDGDVDCVNDYLWSEQASIAADAVGYPTSELALRAALEPFSSGHGGEIVIVRDGIGSLVVDEREQVVARAIELTAGVWDVLTFVGCEGFER